MYGPLLLYFVSFSELESQLFLFGGKSSLGEKVVKVIYILLKMKPKTHFPSIQNCVLSERDALI